jgi:hypothetical protein
MKGAPMLTGKRVATGLITMLMIATLAMPVFAQETTPSDDAVTPVPTTEPTPTPDAEPVTTVKPIPAGQLTRKGIFGDVLEVGGSSITIGTKFGNVTLGVDANTTYAASGGGNDPFGLSNIVVGDRAAVHLNQAPVAEGDPEPTLAPTPTPTATPTTPFGDTVTPTPTATTTPSDDTITPTPTPTATPTPTPTATTTPFDDTITPTPTATTTPSDDAITPTPTATTTPSDDAITPTPTATTTTSDDTITPTPTATPIFVEPSFREVVARSIHIIPSKSNRKHDRTVVTSKCNSNGKNKMTVLDDEGAEVELDCNGESTEAGSDVILLTKNQGKGKGNKVVGSVDPDDIDTRIDNLKGGANEERKAQLDELRAERDAAKEERLEKLEEKTSGANKEKVTGARNKGKGSSSGSGDGTPTPTTAKGGGNSDSGSDKDKGGKPTATPTTTSSGGSSDTGGSGNGNSGNGGGPPDDKDKKPK